MRLGPSAFPLGELLTRQLFEIETSPLPGVTEVVNTTVAGEETLFFSGIATLKVARANIRNPSPMLL